MEREWVFQLLGSLALATKGWGWGAQLGDGVQIHALQHELPGLCKICCSPA